LGPGLLSSVALASNGLPGSKVIICTDGLANVGIGSLEGHHKDEMFYDRVSEYAVEKGVQVSILTIKGDAQCSIKNLGKVANATNGTISRVDPSKLGGEFNKVVEDEIIGIDCEIKIRLNMMFRFRK